MSDLFVNGRLVGSIDPAQLAHVAAALEADDPYGIARRLRLVRPDAELRLAELDLVVLCVSVRRIADGLPAAQLLLDLLSRDPAPALMD